MDCPVCENAMITLELQEVEIDFCSHCSGIWLDAGELEMLLQSPEQAANLLASFTPDTKSNEKSRKCPICRKIMKKVLVGTTEPKVLLDKCKKDHGLWFDKGELQDIISKATLDKDNKIAKLLADMFGEDLQTEQQ
jgi:Zn-finger nucleic acid-binding protein